MHFLVFKEVEATLTRHMDRAFEYVDQQSVFIKNHIAVWVPRFVQQVLKNADTGFYKNLALATDLFIKVEHDRFLSLTSGAGGEALQEST